MKRIIQAAILAGALLTGAAQAEDPCQRISKLAGTIMENRQAGTSMERMIEIASGEQFKSIDKILRHLIVEAYSQPRYNSKPNQQNAVKDFSNDQMLLCMKVRK